MENERITTLMAEDFAGFTREAGLRGKKAGMFVAGCLRKALASAYDSLDHIVSAYDANDFVALDECVKKWKEIKARRINCL